MVRGKGSLSSRFRRQRLSRPVRGVNARQDRSIAKLNKKVKTLTNTLQYKHWTEYDNEPSLTTSSNNLPQIHFRVCGEEGDTSSNYPVPALRENMNINVKSVSVRGQFYSPTARRDYAQVRVLLIRLKHLPMAGAFQPLELDNFITGLDQLGFTGFEATHGTRRSYLNNPIADDQQAVTYDILEDRLYTLRSFTGDGNTAPAANNSPVAFNIKHVFKNGLIQKYSNDNEDMGYANLLFLHFVSSDLGGSTNTITCDYIKQMRWIEG